MSYRLWFSELSNINSRLTLVYDAITAQTQMQLHNSTFDEVCNERCFWESAG